MFTWPLDLLRELRQLVGRRRQFDHLIRRHEGLKIGLWVEIRSPERLCLGRRVTIESGVLLHCGGMDWSGGRGGISVGDDAYIGPNVVLFGAGGIEIGSRVLISPGVVIASHQHSFTHSERPIAEQPAEFATIVIEDNVWIGAMPQFCPG